MADKIVLDFETNTITWDTPSQQGTEYCPELSERKNAILKAMGYAAFDLSDAVSAVNDYINGKITEEEFEERLSTLGEK